MLTRVMRRSRVPPLDTDRPSLAVFGLNDSPSLAGMNTLIGYDLVPEPKILEAALRACRRLNDLASAIRILEAVKASNAKVLLRMLPAVTFF